MWQHAFPGVVVVAESFVEAVPYLTRNYRGRNQLGVRMGLAGPGVDSMILEYGDVGDAVIDAQCVVAILIDT
jgi:hypothetical protein